MEIGEIAHCTGRRDYGKLCASLLGPQKLCTCPNFHGRTYERIALSAFIQQTSLQVQNFGLVIDPSLIFIAALPDRLVGATHTVEVK